MYVYLNIKLCLLQVHPLPLGFISDKKKTMLRKLTQNWTKFNGAKEPQNGMVYYDFILSVSFYRCKYIMEPVHNNERAMHLKISYIF